LTLPFGTPGQVISSEGLVFGQFFSRSHLLPTIVLLGLGVALCLSGSMCDKNPVGSKNTPGVPTLISPVNGSATSDTTPAFDWNDVSAAAGYEIQIDDTLSFSSPAVDTFLVVSSYADTLVLSEDTYYWRVRAKDSGGAWSSWSEAWTFAVFTHGPAAPAGSSPASGATVSDDTPAFVWSSVPTAAGYEIQVDTTSGFASVVIDSHLTVPAYTCLRGLDDKTYWWRVRAKNAADLWSDWSQTLSFIVKTGYSWALSWGSRGPGDGQFMSPWGVAVDGNGYVYVTDMQNNRVQKFTSDGAFVAEWGSAGADNGEFLDPMGIAADGLGNIYVVDSGNNRVEKFTDAGAFVLAWGSESSSKYGPLASPASVATYGTDFIYVTDTQNNRIQKYGSTGTSIWSWGSYGTGDTEFDSPIGIAIDWTGLVCIVDTGNDRIKKFSQGGAYSMGWGSRGDGDGEFRGPYGVALGLGGHIFVTEGVSPTYDCRVQKFKSDGTFVASIGAHGTGARQFNTPRGIAVDGSGRVYVADTGNNRIVRLDPK
jgi:sugar lactone lactonase YvrE